MPSVQRYGGASTGNATSSEPAARRDLTARLSGDEAGSYAVTSNYFNQDGAIRGSGFHAAAVRANLDRRLNSIVRISSSLDVTRSQVESGAFFGHGRARAPQGIRAGGDPLQPAAEAKRTTHASRDGPAG